MCPASSTHLLQLHRPVAIKLVKYFLTPPAIQLPTEPDEPLHPASSEPSSFTSAQPTPITSSGRPKPHTDRTIAFDFSIARLSLLVEEPRRRAELAMYVLPRGLESAWSMMRGRGYVPFIPFGEVVLSASAMSMVMATYQNDPEHLSGLVRRVLYQFIGPN